MLYEYILSGIFPVWLCGHKNDKSVGNVSYNETDCLLNFVCVFTASVL